MRFIIVFILPLLSSFAFADNKITYSERACQLHKSGNVDIIYNIDESGYVDKIRVINEEPKGFFVRGIKNQMDNWRFQKGNPKKDIKLSVKFRYPENKQSRINKQPASAGFLLPNFRSQKRQQLAQSRLTQTHLQSLAQELNSPLKHRWAGRL